MALLLGAKGVDATATVTHSRTPELAALCRTADILVAAIGRPEMITAEYVKPGAAVIDVGISRTEDGLVGDVAYEEVSQIAGAVSPVPGGVGPLTIACLLRNTVMLAEMSAR
jgi:methylenetetrahydrofolate dehydrogenase (NADP+)/methenyltetrahydrofolate cyclohydrolase